MPYIKQELRDPIDCWIVDAPAIDSLGELNYAISRLVYGVFKPTQNYDSIAKITGVLENVKLEMYRKFAAPYEELKEAENGELPDSVNWL